MSKTIYSPNTAFGGYEYRVTSDETTVNVQERKSESVKFKTKRVLTMREWHAIKEQNFDSYNNNPAVLSRLANEG
jgi:nucleoid-associated protein YgaU